jgi:RHH-type proline utilization regulon transcriptional repressor/proline dehydrogenase/delta 1-pyrroline-5-carboxylate dehydrogenase
VPEERLGSRLVKNRRIAGVILTGAAETARRFLDWRPDLRLFAETGGKNSITITDLADRDQAVSDLIHSAFGHAGQKCSAASLGICEAAVYDDPEFRRRLRDAAASLEVGPADSAGVRIPPLIRHPGTELERALNHCEDGQKWLLKPRCLDAEGSRRLWTPGIKLGVKRGSWFHQTECFGPILGLMRARSLDHAISLANAVPYGLTAGLQSLDEREIAHWLEHIDAGNCYVNRSITGAVVRRQPFGGWKASRYGPGAKAGGPRYVDQFRRRHQRDEGRTVSTVDSAWRRIFGRCHDPSALASERNILRWKPRPGLFLALGAEPSVSQQSLLRLVAATAGVPVHTVLNRRPVPAPELPADGVLAIIGQRRDRDELLALAHQQNWLVITEQVPDAESAFGLLMRPQSISITAHRYGNRELGRWHLPGLGAE